MLRMWNLQVQVYLVRSLGGNTDAVLLCILVLRTGITFTFALASRQLTVDYRLYAVRCSGAIRFDNPRYRLHLHGS
jgi:hypothetical protein